ncbi:hypothetical protein ABZ845_12185 [Streptomyces sp. NPDC047022]
MHRSREWLNERMRALRLPAFPERFVKIEATSRLKAPENEYLSTRRS